jgi:hypothetical protein
MTALNTSILTHYYIYLHSNILVYIHTTYTSYYLSYFKVVVVVVESMIKSMVISAVASLLDFSLSPWWNPQIME